MDQLQTLLQALPLLLPVMEQTLETKLDFTIESLQRLENGINKVYPAGHEPLETTLLVLGLYLGEVFIKNNKNACWDSIDPDAGPFFCCAEEERAFIGYPVKRMKNFWFDRSQGLKVYYQMNMDVLEGKIQPEVCTDWKDHKGRYQYRFSQKLSVRKINE
ncbi:hypothetical protein YDYSY3_39360 [Paenibacillus chitinolyticus]|uniref:hypothetical protein n=1 Tax=Paenibacillus chitinolyticus TaxID=79263 RepID=UPI0026E4F96C|nr:hypothetical protein [Paenibacillus chitinolyticus]GKS12936.1 hypothetical protein YDYSY3_39360 [Paenibacillus chitinolyticus]